MNREYRICQHCKGHIREDLIEKYNKEHGHKMSAEIACPNCDGDLTREAIVNDCCQQERELIIKEIERIEGDINYYNNAEFRKHFTEKVCLFIKKLK